MTAVVFDFDGVICDSMGQHAAAYRDLLAPFDIPVGDRQIFLLEGARSESIIQDLADAAGVSLDDVAGLADEKQRLFREAGAPSLYPGADALVRRIQDEAPTAVVTGTRRENLARLIPDLVDRFHAVLSQESYTHDKPHPEPYARAAEALQRDPADCIAVENAIRGVQSAKAAGYGEVIAITTTLESADLHEANLVVPDHPALLAALMDRL